jgi:ATP-binding cassette, subfamily B, bacterial
MTFKNFPHYKQLDTMDCGPTCIMIVAKYYGKYLSLQYLRDKCGMTREGISLLDIAHAAEIVGFRIHATLLSFESLKTKAPLPSIVYWQQKHFVVVYKIDSKHVYISDPATGLVRYTYQEFCDNWLDKADKGAVMALEPQPDFQEFAEGEPRRKYKALQSILAYLKPYKTSLVQLFVVMILITAIQTVLPFIMRAMYDVGIRTKDLGFIYILLIANILLILSTGLANVLKNWLLAHLTSRLNIAMVSDYLIKLMKLPITYFETKMIGDILQRANDHERIKVFLSNVLINTFFSLLSLIVFGVVLFIFNINLFWVFLVGSLLYIGWILLFIKIQEKLDWKTYDLNAKNQSYWIETVNTIQDTKIANYEKKRRWKWEAIQAALYRVNLKSLTVSQTQELGSQIINNLKNIVLTFFSAKAVLEGNMTMGEMISTQFIIGFLNAPIAQLVMFIQYSELAYISFKRLSEIDQITPEENESNTNNFNLPSNKNLTLQNVSFHYQGNKELILKNISIEIPENKTTAIVGHSGCGKTTLLRLILRFYQPSYGEITLGDMNLNSVSLSQWRKNCAAVLQDGRIYNDTILNNIALEDDNIDYEELKEAVKIANIEQEIVTLPLGYQTRIGETGRGLSHGQKQRILLARAVYQNPQFLILDEATSALDSENEDIILTHLETFFENRTVVIAAHRLSTFKRADQVIVLQNGQVAESGKHEELLLKRGIYFNLIKPQLSQEDIERVMQVLSPMEMFLETSLLKQ